MADLALQQVIKIPARVFLDFISDVLFLSALLLFLAVFPSYSI